MQIPALPYPFYRRLPLDDWATYYRWKKRFDTSGLPGLGAPSGRSHPQEHLVWQMRRRYPFCGKLRLHFLWKQDHGFTASVSTVGCIRAKGVRLGRNFPKGPPQHWRYGMKASLPGQLVQIDHSRVYPLPGVQFKEFQTICPLSQHLAAQIRGQIRQFSGEVSVGLPKPAARLVREVIYGVQSRASVRLSEIGRALEEGIRLKKVVERLSRQLNRKGLRQRVRRNLLPLAAPAGGEGDAAGGGPDGREQAVRAPDGVSGSSAGRIPGESYATGIGVAKW